MILNLGRALCNRKIIKQVVSRSFLMEVSGVSLSKVLSALENFAPNKLAESWDNTGLLVEPYTPRTITKVLLTNDLTEDVVLEALGEDCQMIISYHPPIFQPLKSVKQSSWKERIVSLLLEKQIALYSPHTSWDCVQGGVNDWLASAFKVYKSSPILQAGPDPETGAGRFLELESNISLSLAVSAVKTLTGLAHVRLAKAKDKTLDSNIKYVALCAGSGSSVLKNVVADLYVTGEMLHHDVLDATQKGISVILTNHSDSERGFLKIFSGNLESRLGKQVTVIVSAFDKDPLVTI